MENFPARLKQKREEKGLSQEALAKIIAAKSGKQTVSRWERGETEPSIAQLLQLAEALETSVSYLLGEIQAEENETKIPSDKVIVDKDYYIKILEENNTLKQVELERLRNNPGQTPTASLALTYTT